MKPVLRAEDAQFLHIPLPAIAKMIVEAAEQLLRVHGIHQKLLHEALRLHRHDSFGKRNVHQIVYAHLFDQRGLFLAVNDILDRLRARNQILRMIGKGKDAALQTARLRFLRGGRNDRPVSHMYAVKVAERCRGFRHVFDFI